MSLISLLDTIYTIKNDIDYVLDICSCLIYKCWYWCKQWFNQPKIDLKIEVRGKEIGANKWILAQESHYFEVLFNQSNSERNEEDRLVIEQFDYRIVRNLVNFCYSNKKKLKLNQDNIGATLKCAHTYDLRRALDNCAHYIGENMCKDNLILVSEFVPDPALDWVYAKLLHRYRSDVDIHNEFDASEFTHELMKDLAAHNFVHCKDMLKLTLKWYEYDTKNRYHQANSVFNLICFDLIELELLKKLMRSELAKKFNGLRKSLESTAYFKCQEFKRHLANKQCEQGTISLNRSKPPSHDQLPSTDFNMNFRDPDVSLVVDRQSIRTHKAVLLLQAKNLRRMFAGEKEKKNSLTISGHEFTIVQSLVRFMYTNELGLDSGNVEKVVRCAHFLGMDKALDRCSHYMSRNPSADYLILVSQLMPEPILERCFHDLIKYCRPNMRALFADKLDKLNYNVMRETALHSQPFLINDSFRELIIDWFRNAAELRIVFMESLFNRIAIIDEEAPRAPT